MGVSLEDRLAGVSRTLRSRIASVFPAEPTEESVRCREGPLLKEA